MPASFNVHDGLVDVLFSWIDRDLEKAQVVIGNTAKALHDTGRGPQIEVDGEMVQKPFGDLSNQEKIDIVFDYTGFSIRELAKTATVNDAVGEARAAAIADEEAYTL